MASLANVVPVDGYDCEFVEPPPSAFQVDCAICLLKLRDPQQVSCCGKNFCDSCIKRVQLQGQSCPTCKSPFTTFPNKGLKQSLNQLHVYCTHDRDGCEWTGELGLLDKHLIRCQLMGVHQSKRHIRCQYYNQGCKWKGELRQLQQHRKECTHGIVNCTQAVRSKDMPAHMAQNVGAHLRLLGAHNQKLAAVNSVLIVMIWLMIIASAVIIVFTIYATESNVPSLQQWSHAIELNVTTESNITALQEQYHAIKSKIESLQRHYHTIETNITSLQQQYCTIKTQLIHAFTPHEIPVCDSQPSQHVGDKEIITDPSVQDNNVLQSTVWIIYKVLFMIASLLINLCMIAFLVLFKVLFTIASLLIRLCMVVFLVLFKVLYLIALLICLFVLNLCTVLFLVFFICCVIA